MQYSYYSQKCLRNKIVTCKTRSCITPLRYYKRIKVTKWYFPKVKQMRFSDSFQKNMAISFIYAQNIQTNISQLRNGHFFSLNLVIPNAMCGRDTFLIIISSSPHPIDATPRTHVQTKCNIFVVKWKVERKTKENAGQPIRTTPLQRCHPVHFVSRLGYSLRRRTAALI